MSKFNKKVQEILTEQAEIASPYSKEVLSEVGDLLKKNGWALDPKMKDFNKTGKNVHGDKVFYWLSELTKDADGTYSFEMSDEDENGISHEVSAEGIKKEDLVAKIEGYIDND